MSRFLKAYHRLLKSYPIIVQSAQTGLLMGTGDVIAQTFIERKSIKNVNLVRTVQFTCVGCLVAGPTLTIWYAVLAKIFKGKSSPKVVVKKVILDQTIVAPCMLFTLLYLLGAIQGNGLQGTWVRVKRDFFDILINNYKIWPWVQLLNFYVVPLQYQVLLVQVIAIFWNSYISWKTQHEEVDNQVDSESKNID